MIQTTRAEHPRLTWTPKPGLPRPRRRLPISLPGQPGRDRCQLVFVCSKPPLTAPGRGPGAAALPCQSPGSILGVCATLAAQSALRAGLCWEGSSCSLSLSPGKRAALAARARLAARSAWQGKRLFISSPISWRDATPGKVQEPFQ